jgi:hypothetical protein
MFFHLLRQCLRKSSSPSCLPLPHPNHINEALVITAIFIPYDSASGWFFLEQVQRGLTVREKEK